MINTLEQFFTLLLAVQDNALALFTLVAFPSLVVAALALMVVWTAIRKTK